ncbi:MAG: MerC domain-containing protein [Bacteroidota bacterium]
MQENKLNWDLVGMWAAGVCAVHCALLPILLTIGALSGVSAWAHPVVETVFVGTSLLIGIFVLIPQYRNAHHRLTPLLLMTLGLLLIVGGHFLGLHEFEPVFTTIGGLTVLTSHFLNWRYYKKSLV